MTLKSQPAGIVNGVPPKRIAAVVVVALVAGVAAVAAPGASASRGGCAPSGATVLRSSDASRVYSLREVLYACLGAERIRLGSLIAGPAGRVDRYALTARYVGFDVVTSGVDQTNSTVSMIDLAVGPNPVVAIIAARPLARPESFVSVTDLAVSGDGIIAWTARRSSLGVRTDYQVYVATAQFENQLAAGPTPFTHLYFGGDHSTVLHWRVGVTGAVGSWALYARQGRLLQALRASGPPPS